MFGLFIFLTVILFIFLLLSCNVKFVITFENEMSIYIKYLFFKFNVKSNSKKEKNVNNKDDKENAQVKTEKDNIKREKNKENLRSKNKIKKIIDEKGFWGFLKIAKNLIIIIKNFSTYLLKHIYVVKFDLEVKISEEDSAQTAIKYGQACAVLYPAMNFIFQNIKIKEHKVTISPDFNGEKTTIYFASVFKIGLIYILKASFVAFFKFIKNFISLKNKNLKTRKV